MEYQILPMDKSVSVREILLNEKYLVIDYDDFVCEQVDGKILCDIIHKLGAENFNAMPLKSSVTRKYVILPKPVTDFTDSKICIVGKMVDGCVFLYISWVNACILTSYDKDGWVHFNGVRSNVRVENITLAPTVAFYYRGDKFQKDRIVVGLALSMSIVSLDTRRNGFFIDDSNVFIPYKSCREAIL